MTCIEIARQLLGLEPRTRVSASGSKRRRLGCAPFPKFWRGCRKKRWFLCAGSDCQCRSCCCCCCCCCCCHLSADFACATKKSGVRFRVQPRAGQQRAAACDNNSIVVMLDAARVRWLRSEGFWLSFGKDKGLGQYSISVLNVRGGPVLGLTKVAANVSAVMLLLLLLLLLLQLKSRRSRQFQQTTLNLFNKQSCPMLNLRGKTTIANAAHACAAITRLLTSTSTSTNSPVRKERHGKFCVVTLCNPAKRCA